MGIERERKEGRKERGIVGETRVVGDVVMKVLKRRGCLRYDVTRSNHATFICHLRFFFFFLHVLFCEEADVSLCFGFLPWCVTGTCMMSARKGKGGVFLNVFRQSVKVADCRVDV